MSLQPTLIRRKTFWAVSENTGQKQTEHATALTSFTMSPFKDSWAMTKQPFRDLRRQLTEFGLTSVKLMLLHPRVKSIVILVERTPIMVRLIRIFTYSTITPKTWPLLTIILTYSTIFYKAVFKVGVACRISMALCGSFFIDSWLNVLFYNTNILITF